MAGSNRRGGATQRGIKEVVQSTSSVGTDDDDDGDGDELENSSDEEEMIDGDGDSINSEDEDEEGEDGEGEDEDEEDSGADSGDATSDEDDGFEVQSSSSEENSLAPSDDGSEEGEGDKLVSEGRYRLREAEHTARTWRSAGSSATASGTTTKGITARGTSTSHAGSERALELERTRKSAELLGQQYLHNDDLSSDDEDATGNNTIGRVPLHWYDAFDHIGYDVSGEKLMKRRGVGDRLDQALAQRDDPEARRTVYDMYNDREVVLTERELEIIRRVQAGAFAHPEFDDTPDYIDYYSSQREVMPISAAPEPKRRFVPSKWEMMRVMKMVKAIQEGRYTEGPRSKQQEQSAEQSKPPVYLIWNDDEDEVLAESRRHKFHLPAPKLPLPGHAESYRPPSEYLVSAEEARQLQEMDPSERPYNFEPKSHACLRHVAGYSYFVKERFERCLDLYLCPRKLKRRLNIDPETLVPRLPSPRELKPFPNTLCLQFLGHRAAVRSISISPDGQYLASGSDDGTVKLWELDSCLCRYTWDLQSGPVISVLWNPDPSHALLVAAAGSSAVLIATGTGDRDATELTETHLAAVEGLAATQARAWGGVDCGADDDDDDDEGSEDGVKVKNKKCTWELCSVTTSEQYTESTKKSEKSRKNADAKQEQEQRGAVLRHGARVGPRVRVQLPGREPVARLAWHYKGDYLAVVAPSAPGARSVSIHQISKGNTQFPFAKSPGRVQTVCFHPSRPFLFVVTQQSVKVFHLVEQRLVKRLLSGCKWLSSVDVHSSGDHVVLGSYDRRVVWFDLDLSSAPYRTLKFHEKAVRCVQLHRRYPLMASAADDGNVHIFHSMVYNDLTRNPLLVPLKVLRGHGVVGGAGVFSIAFHPRQPWIVTAGADSVINLYQDI